MNVTTASVSGTSAGSQAIAKPERGRWFGAEIPQTFCIYCGILILIAIVEWGPLLLRTLFFKHLPSSLPLASPSIRLTDWTNFLRRVSHFGEPGMLARRDLGYPFPYPLPTLYVFLAFVKAFAHPTRAYLVAATLSFVVPALWLIADLRLRKAPVWSQAALLCTLFFGFPHVFLIDRGNVEVFLWVFVALALYAFVKGHNFTSAVLFALAGSMKIYPSIFLLLFLARRKFGAFALGAASLAVFTLLSAQIIGPSASQAMQDMRWSAQYLRDAQIAVPDEPALAADHSAFAFVKQARYVVHRFVLRRPGADYLTFYSWTAPYSIVAILCFVLVYLLRLRRLPLLNQFIGLCIFSVLLPYVSYIYTLVHIYFVFAVLLLYLVQDRPALTGRGPAFTAICLAITLSAVNVLALFHFRGQLQCLTLIGLLIVVLREPMPSTLFGDRTPGQHGTLDHA